MRRRHKRSRKHNVFNAEAIFWLWSQALSCVNERVFSQGPRAFGRADWSAAGLRQTRRSFKKMQKLVAVMYDYDVRFVIYCSFLVDLALSGFDARPLAAWRAMVDQRIDLDMLRLMSWKMGRGAEALWSSLELPSLARQLLKFKVGMSLKKRKVGSTASCEGIGIRVESLERSFMIAVYSLEILDVHSNSYS